MFGGVPGKVLDIDKRLLLEKGSDFETLRAPKRPLLSISPSSSGLCPHLPPLTSLVPPAFSGPSPFLSLLHSPRRPLLPSPSSPRLPTHN